LHFLENSYDFFSRRQKPLCDAFKYMRAERFQKLGWASIQLFTWNWLEAVVPVPVNDHSERPFKNTSPMDTEDS